MRPPSTRQLYRDVGSATKSLLESFIETPGKDNKRKRIETNFGDDFEMGSPEFTLDEPINNSSDQEYSEEEYDDSTDEESEVESDEEFAEFFGDDYNKKLNEYITQSQMQLDYCKEDVEADDNITNSFKGDITFEDTLEKNRPLYTGSTLTILMFVASVASIYNSSNMSIKVFEKLLHLLSDIIHPLPKSWTFPLKAQDFLSLIAKFDYEEHRYCRECNEEIQDSEKCCPTCKTKLSKFYLTKIETWFDNMIKMVGESKWFELLQIGLKKTSEHIIQDFADEVYDNITNWFIHQGLTIHDTLLYFLLSADGGCRFRTSSRSFWPFSLCCLNLPKSIRYSIDFTCIIAFADHKIHCPLVLRCIVDNFKRLIEGKKIGKTNLRSALSIISTDNMAAFEFSGMIAPQGYSSCSTCQQEGIYFNNRVVFPTSTIDDPSSRSFRSKELWEKHAIQAEESGKTVHGINYLSVLIELPYIDISKLFTGDLLHDFMLGFLKKVLKQIKIKIGDHQWKQFHSKYIQHKYPQIFHRQPRGIIFKKNSNDVTKIKAIELWNLFIYMFPLFQEFTNDVKFNSNNKELTLYNYLQDVASVGNILLNPANRNDLEGMRRKIYFLLRNTEIVFGKELMSLVSHKLIHYPFFIKWHGPLYLLTTFPMENLISVFMNAITGTFNIERKSLHGVVIKQRMWYVKRQLGELANHFGIGNTKFIYSPLFGYTKMKKTKDGFTLKYCQQIIESQEHKFKWHKEEVVQKLDKSFVPCFCLKLKEWTILIPIHYNMKYFL